MDDYSTSSELLDLIDKEIAYNESKNTRIKSAIIDSVNSDGTVTLYIPPDYTRFSNIQNQSIYKLTPGMSVKVLKENNVSNNMWVIGVFNEKQAKKRFLEYLTPEELEEIQKYKTTETIIVSSCNEGSGGTGGGGGGSEDDPGTGGGGEDDPGTGGGGGEYGGLTEEYYKRLFYIQNEILELKNYSTAGPLINNKLYFSIPLSKQYGNFVTGFNIKNLEIIAVGNEEYILGSSSSSGGFLNICTNNIIKNIGNMTVSNNGKGVISFEISPSIVRDGVGKFADDGNGGDAICCGILLNLKIEFGDNVFGY